MGLITELPSSKDLDAEPRKDRGIKSTAVRIDPSYL
jgi:hypothetical protein